METTAFRPVCLSSAPALAPEIKREVSRSAEDVLSVCVSGSGRLLPSHLPRQLRGAYLCARLVSASLLRDLRVGKPEAG